MARAGGGGLRGAVLQQFLLGSRTEQEYLDTFVYNYGEWNRGTAQELWLGRAGSALSQRYYAYAMLRQIAEVSKAIVVHNPAAARIVREHAPHARVVEIPHLFAPPHPISTGQILSFRQSLHLSTHHFVFGVFGYLRQSKRI